jgi:hypothetical protein
VRQSGKVGGGKAVVPVLDKVQMLDQQIAVSWFVCKQGLDVAQRARVDLSALWMRDRLAAAGAGMAAGLAIAA